MATDYVIACDVGTSEMKTSLISNSKGLIDEVRRTYPIEYPKPGWSEQDPNLLKEAIYSSIKELIDKNLEKVPNIQGLTFTSQMMGLLPLGVNGTPIHKLMTWLDTRSADLVKSLFSKGLIKIEGYQLKIILKFLNITGGAPGFSGKDNISKILWLKKFEPEIYQKTYNI